MYSIYSLLKRLFSLPAHQFFWKIFFFKWFKGILINNRDILSKGLKLKINNFFCKRKTIIIDSFVVSLIPCTLLAYITSIVVFVFSCNCLISSYYSFIECLIIYGKRYYNKLQVFPRYRSLYWCHTWVIIWPKFRFFYICVCKLSINLFIWC